MFILRIWTQLIIHRRRIKTEEKAKVVASVSAEKFIQILAAQLRHKLFSAG